jgi:hypothetical protein
MKEVGYLIETGWSASGRKRQRTKLAVWNKFGYRASVSCEPSIRPCTYWAERLQRESRTINVSHVWEKYTVSNENTAGREGHEVVQGTGRNDMAFQT